MIVVRLAAIAAVIAGAAACANTAPRPEQRITLTDRQTGQRVETTDGALSALAAFAELRNRNYGRAIEIATRALASPALTPTERSLNHTVRGIAHMMLRDAARARAEFDSAISADPENHLAWAERGVLNGARRLYGEAIADLGRSIAIRPTALAHFERGRVKLLIRDLAGARADFDAALAINPRFATAYFARGLAHHLAGRFQAARADYRQSLAIDPDLEPARRALAALERRRAPAGLPPGRRPGEIVRF